MSSALILSCWDSERITERTEHQVENDSLITLIERQQKTIDSLVQSPTEESPDGYPILFGRAFRDIEDPEAFIAEDLRQRSELIPLDAVLGGTMAFRKIQVLSDKWVMTIYDDGHIQGQAIFEYRLTPEKNLEYDLVTFDHPE